MRFDFVNGPLIQEFVDECESESTDSLDGDVNIERRARMSSCEVSDSSSSAEINDVEGSSSFTALENCGSY